MSNASWIAKSSESKAVATEGQARWRVGKVRVSKSNEECSKEEYVSMGGEGTARIEYRVLTVSKKCWSWLVEGTVIVLELLSDICELLSDIWQ